MASSQDKAIALKDAYVNGIMDGAVEQKAADTQQAFAQMPGQGMGEVASHVMDYGRNTQSFINDGIPKSTILDPANGLMVEMHSPRDAMPVDNDDTQYSGAFGTPLFKAAGYEKAPMGTYVERGFEPSQNNSISRYNPNARRMGQADYSVHNPRNNSQLTQRKASEEFLNVQGQRYKRVD